MVRRSKQARVILGLPYRLFHILARSFQLPDNGVLSELTQHPSAELAYHEDRHRRL